jgi:hypothetical protein
MVFAGFVPNMALRLAGVASRWAKIHVLAIVIFA